MNKLGHILFSTAIFIFLYYMLSNHLDLDVTKILFAYFIFIVYSLLPDIDKNNSWIRKQLNTIIFILILFFTLISLVNQDQTALLIAAILVVVVIILTIIKHRGAIHTLSFGIIASVPLLFIDPLYFFAGFIGVITHLIADKI